MVYTRAENLQIDAWEEVGNEGWNWQSLFPYYKKSQRLLVPSDRALEAGVSYNPAFHGFDGPVDTGWPRRELVSEYLPALNQSYPKLGIPWNPDPAGGSTRGLGVSATRRDCQSRILTEIRRTHVRGPPATTHSPMFAQMQVDLIITLIRTGQIFT